MFYIMNARKTDSLLDTTFKMLQCSRQDNNERLTNCTFFAAKATVSPLWRLSALN